MKLTPLQLQQLCDLIVDAFLEEELERVTVMHLGEALPVIVPTKGPRTYVVFQLVGWTERHGVTEWLIRGIQKARPSRADIQAIAREVLGEQADAVDDASPSKPTVGTALAKTTANQIQPATRDDLAALRDEIRLVREALANKPAPSANGQPPAVPAPVVKAAHAVEHNPEAGLLVRTEAAIVSRSPDALDRLEQLDAMVETADYKRHELRGDYHYFRGEFDKAIEPFEKGMALPNEWATSQYNLAIAVALLAEQPNLPPGETHCGLLRRAIACSKGALTVHTAEAFPREHARTVNNLNIDRRAYEAAGCANEMPFDDIPPAE